MMFNIVVFCADRGLLTMNVRIKPDGAMFNDNSLRGSEYSTRDCRFDRAMMMLDRHHALLLTRQASWARHS